MWNILSLVHSLIFCLSQSGRIAADESVVEEELSEAAVAELQAEKEAKARATVLEIVGDLPEADAAPPENVLFVCKLNPVTTDEDLELIFRRFGNIKRYFFYSNSTRRSFFFVLVTF